MTDSFDILAAEYRPMVVAYLRSMVGDPHLAEDLAQESFLAAQDSIAKFEKGFRNRKGTLDKGLQEGIYGVMVEGRCHDNQVGVDVFLKELFGHIVLVNAFARGLAPAGEASDAVVDLLLLQVHYINVSAGLSHPLDEMVQNDFRLAFLHI